MQVDNLMELPKEKRPPEFILWWGTADELEEWLDEVMGHKKEAEPDVGFIIRQEDIE